MCWLRCDINHGLDYGTKNYQIIEELSQTIDIWSKKVIAWESIWGKCTRDVLELVGIRSGISLHNMEVEFIENIISRKVKGHRAINDLSRMIKLDINIIRGKWKTLIGTLKKDNVVDW